MVQGNPRVSRHVSRARALGRNVAIPVAVAAGIVVALELVLAACGVRPLLREGDPYVGFTSRVPLFERTTDAGGSPVLTTAANKLALFNAQTFRAHKPPKGFRVFCVGGSTTYGRPYDDATSF